MGHGDGVPFEVQDAATASVVLDTGPQGPEILGRQDAWVVGSLPLRQWNSVGLVGRVGNGVGLNTMMIGPGVGLSVPTHLVKAFLREHLDSAPTA